MIINQKRSLSLKMALAICFSFLFSLNSYAVKKSAADINNPQASSVIIDKQEKPNFFQRIGLKILSKRVEKKIAKYEALAEQGEKKKKGMAVASLILGIVAVLSFLNLATILLGVVAGTLAIVFGLIGRKRAINQPEKYGGKGMALAGFILGTVFVALFIAGLIFLLQLAD